MLRDLVQSNPKSFSAQMMLADLQRTVGDKEEEAAALRRALEARPMNPWPYIQLGRMAVAEGRPDEAVVTSAHARHEGAANQDLPHVAVWPHDPVMDREGGAGLDRVADARDVAREVDAVAQHLSPQMLDPLEVRPQQQQGQWFAIELGCDAVQLFLDRAGQRDAPGVRGQGIAAP